MNEKEILDFNPEKRKLVVFERYMTVEDAQPLISLLKEENIPYKFEQIQMLIDAAIVGQSLYPKYLIRVASDQVEKINEILDQDLKANLAWLKEEYQDHFIQDFSKEELLEIVENPKEWNRTLVILAKEILKDRGEEEALELAMKRTKMVSGGNAIEAPKDPIWIALMILMAIAILSIFTYWLVFQ